MANRNGLGPLNMGPLTGRGKGNCVSENQSRNRLGLGLGVGMGLALGCGRMIRNSRRMKGGFHLGRSAGFGRDMNQESLTVYKKQLEQELEAINRQMREDTNN